MFRIGEFAAMSGVNAKMLRHYDEIGLFHPAWVDPSNEYRYYSAAQLAPLQRIVALRDVGMPLAEIAELLTGGGNLADALTARRRELVDRRRRMDRMLARLDISIELAAETGPALDVVVRRQAGELIAGLKRPLAHGEDLGRPFYELESAVRDAGVRAPRPSLSLHHDDGVTEVAVPVTANFAAVAPIHVWRLPASRVVSIIHTGAYDGLGDAADALDAWISDAGYRVSGPLREIYLRFSAERELEVPDRFLADRGSDFVTELQQPVIVRTPGATGP